VTPKTQRVVYSLNHVLFNLNYFDRTNVSADADDIEKPYFVDFMSFV